MGLSFGGLNVAFNTVEVILRWLVIKALNCKLLTIGKLLPTFPHTVLGFELLTSEVGGEYVTTAPPWSLT